MKKTLLLKAAALLFITSLFFTHCSKDDDPKRPECLPVTISDNWNGLINIIYGNSGVKEITVQDAGGAVYRNTYTYDNFGKLKRMDGFMNGVKESYSEISYESNQIINSHYLQTDSGFQKTLIDKYYLAGGKIVKQAKARSSDNFTAHESNTFEYDSTGNLTKLAIYDKNDDLSGTMEFSYDDKINPYHLIGYGFGGRDLLPLIV
jgi:hypothetical protein